MANVLFAPSEVSREGSESGYVSPNWAKEDIIDAQLAESETT